MIKSLMHSPFHVLFDGQIAVIVFIVISGFFYQKDLKFSLRNYWVGIEKKILRIWIPYALVIIIGVIACNIMTDIDYEKLVFSEWANSFWTDKVSFAEFLKHLIILLPHDTHLIDPPSWYVPVEVRLFLIVPIVVMIANTNKYAKLVYIPFIFLMTIGKSIYVGACIMGCVCRMVYNQIFDKVDKYKYSNIFKFFILLISIYLLNINNEMNVATNAAFTIQVIGATLLVPLVFSINSSIMANKILVWFGNISYEFYLIHFIILLALRPYFVNSVFYIVLTFILSVLLSVCIQKFSNWIVTKMNVINFFRLRANSPS